MTALLTTEDTLILDEMLGHEAGCAASHSDSDNRFCSVAVTHRFSTSCGICKLVCAASGNRTESLIAAGGTSCGYCFKPLANCWKVLPA